MTKISDLIAKLSNEAKLVEPLENPSRLAARILSILILYAFIVQYIIGLREDFTVQITRALFIVELVLFFLLFASSTVSAALSIYPDSYQKSYLQKIPFIIFIFLAVVFVAQLFIPSDAKMLMPENFHKMGCSISILFFSLVPSLIIFGFLRKGASTIPAKSGLFAILAATALGCLISRLHEANDSISHMITWHFLPIIIFSILGAVIGKFLLRW